MSIMGSIKKLGSKELRPQSWALKLKFSKPNTEIPKQVRDDKKGRTESPCHAELVSASGYSRIGK
jgi:hypothetical protein